VSDDDTLIEELRRRVKLAPRRPIGQFDRPKAYLPSTIEAIEPVHAKAAHPERERQAEGHSLALNRRCSGLIIGAFA
jgi:hypothetical protein